jgi:DNA (cytosine-5)-methyltransferase 1
VIREDFAAAGGVSEGLRLAGVDMDQVIGVEWERDACATAEAAGHRRINTDVRAVRGIDWSRIVGYSAGPPCQTFSMAGGGSGRKHLDALRCAVELVARGKDPEAAIASVDDDALDDRSVLVLEPLHVIAHWLPQWVILEQVPQVLPIWQAYAEQLEGIGYSVQTGILKSEQYGVPQTRRRAILVAHQDQPATLPAPTHSEYYYRQPKRLDPGVLPWVSMAEALTDAGLPVPADYVRSNYRTGGNPETPGIRRADQPAATVTSKVDRNRWQMGTGGRAAVARPRELDQPAATITTVGAAAWLPTEGPWRYVGSDMAHAARRPLDAPAGTILASSHPHWEAPPLIEGEAPRGRQVSVEEAAVLQSFRPDYPWQGTKSSRYRQVGNAHPPLMAAAIARNLMAAPAAAAAA